MARSKPGSASKAKRCAKCGEQYPATDKFFRVDSRASDGLKSRCKSCQSERGDEVPARLMATEEQSAPPPTAAGFYREALVALSAGGSLPAPLLAHVESRLKAHWSAREAREVLALVSAWRFAERRLGGRIAASGRARKKPGRAAQQSTVVFLSDLHLQGPNPALPYAENRRLARVLERALDYEPHTREQSECVLLLNGDLIEGELDHGDPREVAPLTQQILTAWEYLGTVIAHLAAEYPRVRVYGQAGNHDRRVSRHQHRALSARWDSHGFVILDGLRRQCSELQNVSFSVTYQDHLLIPLYDSHLYALHGDAGARLRSPDTHSEANLKELVQINNALALARRPRFGAAAISHWHAGIYEPGGAGVPHVVYNGGLPAVSPYAKHLGKILRPQGQWLWRATEGEPVGGADFVSLGPEDDNDARLDGVIPLFSMPEAS